MMLIGVMILIAKTVLHIGLRFIKIHVVMIINLDRVRFNKSQEYMGHKSDLHNELIHLVL